MCACRHVRLGVQERGNVSGLNRVFRYLSDLCYLEIREGTSLQWQCPVFEGPSPSPRESHASVTIGTRLLIYGGMNGRRLGDVWILEVGE